MNRQYKLIIIITIAIITIFFSYYFFNKKEFIYLSIKDSFVNNQVANSQIYTYENLLLKDFKQNNENVKIWSYRSNYISYLYKSIKDDNNDITYYIKNAKVITISVGTYEFINYKEINEEIIVNYLNDLYKVLREIRYLNSNDIYIVSLLYLSNYQIDYINTKIQKFSKELDIKYITLDNQNLSSFLKIDNKIYITQIGHNGIYSTIKKS